MIKLFSTLLVILFCSSYVFASNSDKVGNILAGTLSAGVATWSWFEVSKSNSFTKVFIDFVAVYFTVKSVIHFAKAIVE